MTNNLTYRLATKTPKGEVIAFGPLMSRAIAERKRIEVARLAPSYPVYMINTAAE